MRRRELLGGAGGLAVALTTLCMEHAETLMRSAHASEIVVEVCRGGQSGMLVECLPKGSTLSAVHDALVAAVVGDSAGCSTAAKPEHQEPVLTHFFGSRALRRLVLASCADDASGASAAAFVGKMWVGVLEGRCQHWIDTHAAKVLAALLECGDAHVRVAAAQEMAALMPGTVNQWALRLTRGNKAEPGSGSGKHSRRAAEQQQQQQQQS